MSKAELQEAFDRYKKLLRQYEASLLEKRWPVSTAYSQYLALQSEEKLGAEL